MDNMPNYDAWLERPYQRNQTDPPREWEEWADVRIFDPEEDEHGTVIGFETWEDADEDGKYGGVDLIVRFDNGREVNMPADRVQELAVK